MEATAVGLPGDPLLVPSGRLHVCVSWCPGSAAPCSQWGLLLYLLSQRLYLSRWHTFVTGKVLSPVFSVS